MHYPLCTFCLVDIPNWPVEPGGGRHSNTWTWWRTFALLTPVFDVFRSHWVRLLCPSRSYWPLLSAEKISFSLSHLVPEIIWAKVGLIFNKNLSFDHFETFYTNFLLDFRSYWPPFLQFLDLFDPKLIFTKPQIPLGPFFHRVLNPLPNIWWSDPPGPIDLSNYYCFHKCCGITINLLQ